jgi:hypothetical protein
MAAALSCQQHDAHAVRRCPGGNLSQPAELRGEFLISNSSPTSDTLLEALRINHEAALQIGTVSGQGRRRRDQLGLALYTSSNALKVKFGLAQSRPSLPIHDMAGRSLGKRASARRGHDNRKRHHGAVCRLAGLPACQSSGAGEAPQQLEMLTEGRK